MNLSPKSDFEFNPDTGGILLVDKPLTWTSFDVVGKLRIAMRIAAGRKLKVGHAGTLDPLASGLLILAYGPFTKSYHTSPVKEDLHRNAHIGQCNTDLRPGDRADTLRTVGKVG